MDENKTEEHKIHEHRHAEAHKPAEERRHKKFHLRKSTVWMCISLVLAVLLVVSIFTHGFSFSKGIDKAITDVDSLMAAEKSDSVKTQLSSIKADLVAIKSQVTGIPTAPSISVSTGGGDVAKLDFYVMSQCPYGTQVEDAIKPVLDQLGAQLDFNLNFIADDNGDGTFTSLHGQNEVLGDIVQLCAAKYNPDKYMTMVVCQNKNAAGIPANWEQCAKDNGLATDSIKTCYEGAEGKQLLSDSIKETAKVSATGSPTIYLNGQAYSGGRQSSDFLRGICNAFSTKPQACLNIPAPVKVNMIVVNDKRCAACDVTRLVSQLKTMFPGIQIENLDYSDAKGKQIYNDLQLGVLPAMLFDSTVEKGESYASVQQYLVKTGDYYSLRIGAEFDPTAEICDNGIDDTGDGLIDCADPDCTAELVCRKETAKTLDLFVMSQCPYGIQALDAMKEVLTNFKGNIDFSVHYIANENPDGTFTSLHGQGEVDEDIREVCAAKYYPDSYKYMDYIWCRNKNIKGTDWESCATQAGMSAATIKSCFEGTEGKSLLKENIKLTDELSIGSSPTFLANNKQEFGGIDAETVKTNYCAANAGLAGCLNKLTGSTASTAAGSCAT